MYVIKNIWVYGVPDVFQNYKGMTEQMTESTKRCEHKFHPEEWTTNDKGQVVYPCLKCGVESYIEW